MRIKDYFLIGDLHSAALVSEEGSLDWLCLPHFDSPSFFARLLDPDGGCFAVESDNYEVDSDYVKDTAIVKHVFSKNDHQFILKDYMVPREKEECEQHFLVRKFGGATKKTKIKLKFRPRPYYGRSNTIIEYLENESLIKMDLEKDKILIYLPPGHRFRKKGNDCEVLLELDEREEKALVMEYILEGHQSAYDNDDREKQTEDFWKNWVSQGQFFSFCRDEMVRCAITLKLMQFYPTGAIIAAPTTSLPADPGGERNWDYRYVWIRDATFTLYSLNILGYHEEAERYFGFIKKIIHKHGSSFPLTINPVYTINGDEVPREVDLKHFSGYQNSKPVRIGNLAADQLQIDVYGNLIDTYYFMSTRGKYDCEKDKDLILMMLERIRELWNKPDSGIWEQRKERKRYTYSRVVSWVGVDRVIRISEKLGLTEKQVSDYKRLRKEIHDWLWDNCFENSNLVQYPQAGHRDATNFLFVLLHFLDKYDPSTKEILDNTAKELSEKEVFVYRYTVDDGLPGKDRAFLLCSFWMISAYAIIEEVDKATQLFKEIEEYMNKSGLFPEQMDPDTGEFLGNYTQAFTHMGMIMAAHYLDKYTSKKAEK